MKSFSPKLFSLYFAMLLLANPTLNASSPLVSSPGSTSPTKFEAEKMFEKDWTVFKYSSGKAILLTSETKKVFALGKADGETLKTLIYYSKGSLGAVPGGMQMFFSVDKMEKDAPPLPKGWTAIVFNDVPYDHDCFKFLREKASNKVVDIISEFIAGSLDLNEIETDLRQPSLSLEVASPPLTEELVDSPSALPVVAEVHPVAVQPQPSNPIDPRKTFGSVFPPHPPRSIWQKNIKLLNGRANFWEYSYTNSDPRIPFHQLVFTLIPKFPTTVTVNPFLIHYISNFYGTLKPEHLKNMQQMSFFLLINGTYGPYFGFKEGVSHYRINQLLDWATSQSFPFEFANEILGFSATYILPPYPQAPQGISRQN